MKKSYNNRTLMGILLFLMLSVSMVPAAAAHRVAVFAWIDGQTVHTQSKFGGGRKAQKAPIQVYDLQDKLLLEGRTNDQGEFSFEAPGRMDMKIVRNAGTGHRAEWIVRAADFVDRATDTPVASTPLQPSASRAAEAAATPATPSTVSGISTAELQQVVEAALDKKLQPVIRMLAEANTAGPTLKDILGGIGYILGLVGIATYFRYRK